MSIIINIKDDNPSKRKPSQSTIMCLEAESNLRDEDFLTLSDKSAINMPKYLNANANDLNKINIVLEKCKLSNLTGDQFDTGEKELCSVNLDLNTSSISSLTNQKKCYTKETNLNNSNNECYRYTIQTFNEKNIYDEINRLEAEKCFDQLE